MFFPLVFRYHYFPASSSLSLSLSHFQFVCAELSPEQIECVGLFGFVMYTSNRQREKRAKKSKSEGERHSEKASLFITIAHTLHSLYICSNTHSPVSSHFFPIYLFTHNFSVMESDPHTHSQTRDLFSGSLVRFVFICLV